MISHVLRLFIPRSFQVLRQYKVFNATTIRNSSECFKYLHNDSYNRILDRHLYRAYSQQATPEALTVNYEDVQKATSNSNIMIVDVREPDEIKEHGKIPNSINIPLGNVASVLSTMSEKEFQQTYNRAKPQEDTEIIFYCMIGKRSGMAQQNAINLGFKNTNNYLGSWTDWATKKSQ